MSKISFAFIYYVILITTHVHAIEAPKHKVLFLCTGNYYRSRFAEAYMNHLSEKLGKNIVAISRGTDVSTPRSRPISPYTQKELAKRDVDHKWNQEFPRRLEASDLEDVDVFIGMNDMEHRGYVEKYFPGFDKNKIRYWNIPDIMSKLDADRNAAIDARRMALLVEELSHELEMLPAPK